MKNNGFYLVEIKSEINNSLSYSIYNVNGDICQSSGIKDKGKAKEYLDFLNSNVENEIVSFLEWSKINEEFDSGNGLFLEDLEIKSLNGIHFSYKVKDFSNDFLKNGLDKEYILFSFKRNLLEEIFNTSKLEGSNLTLIETKTILDGVSVGGKRLEDIDLVRNLENSNKLLLNISKGEFEFSKDKFCSIHKEVAKEEALKWGIFRDKKVYISGLNRDVTESSELDRIFKEGKNFFNEYKMNIFQKAFLIFLWGAYHQFFFDGNKRTSRMFGNYLLLSSGFYGLTIYFEDQKEYNEVMMNLYETGNADEALKFLEKTYEKNIRKFIDSNK